MRGLTSSWSCLSTSMTQACRASPSWGAARPTPGRVAHRVGEVVEQLVQVLAEAVDRLALQAQAGVAQHDDRADAHGAEYMGRRPRGVRIAGVGRLGAWLGGRVVPRVGGARRVEPSSVAASARRGRSSDGVAHARRPGARLLGELAAGVGRRVAGLVRERRGLVGRDRDGSAALTENWWTTGVGLLGEVFDRVARICSIDVGRLGCGAGAGDPRRMSRSMPPRLPSSGRGVGLARASPRRAGRAAGLVGSVMVEVLLWVAHRRTNELTVREPGGPGRIIGATDDPRPGRRAGGLP